MTPFEAIAVENLLDAYPGYDGRPVSGAAFVGREEEIAVSGAGVGRQNPGAIVLYMVCGGLGRPRFWTNCAAAVVLLYRSTLRALFCSAGG